MHISLEALLSAGRLPSRTVGEPGIHGALVMGMQGMGTSTPMAAAVAAATTGLASEVHMPNGRMLTMGLLSMMLASGIAVITWLTGSTIKVPGARPNEHFNIAPEHTSCPINHPLAVAGYVRTG